MKFRGEVTKAAFLNDFLIHASRPKVSHLLLNRSAACRFDRSVFHRLAQDCIVPNPQGAKGTPTPLIWRNGISREELVARELVKILTRVYGAVDLVGIKCSSLGCFSGVCDQAPSQQKNTTTNRTSCTDCIQASP